MIWSAGAASRFAVEGSSDHEKRRRAAAVEGLLASPACGGQAETDELKDDGAEHDRRML
jgi:hypothetical protein